jgi:hypothetical protein
MQAYNIIVDLAYVARPKLYPYFVARWCQFFLKHKIACIYTPAVYVTVAVVLSRDLSSRNVLLGHRIGKLSLRTLDHCHSSISQLPSLHLLYYGHVGILFQPMQASSSCFIIILDLHSMYTQLSIQMKILAPTNIYRPA